MKLKATQLRKGMIIEFNNDLYQLTDVMHITPGKGQAVADRQRLVGRRPWQSHQGCGPIDPLPAAAVCVSRRVRGA